MDGSKDTTRLSQTAKDFEFIIYEPPQFQHRLSSQATARWEKLADRIASPQAATHRRFCADDLMGFPVSVKGTCTEAASYLASRLSLDQDKRNLQGLLLLSICTILYVSGRAPPETLDRIVQTIARSEKPRYLDTLKRGARVANEIIAEWAAYGGENVDQLQGLDRATQAILHARLSVSQWGTISEHSRQVKERILGRPLPQVEPGPPLLLPLAVSQMVDGSLKLDEICRYLGYNNEQINCMKAAAPLEPSTKWNEARELEVGL